jgi:hypothetical protein
MIHRIDVKCRDGADPTGAAVRKQIAEMADPIVETAEIFSGSIDDARPQPHRSPPQARRDGPRRRQHRNGHWRPGLNVRQVRTGRALSDFDAENSRSSPISAHRRPRPRQRRHRIRPFRCPIVPRSFPDRPRSSPSIRRVELRNLSLTSPARQDSAAKAHLFLIPAGDEGHPILFPPPGARADRHRTGNSRPDLERALRPQNAQERRRRRNPRSPGKVIGQRRYENLIKETIFASTHGTDELEIPRSRFASRSSPTTPASSPSTKPTPSASRSKRTIIPAPSNPTAAAPPAPAASSAISSAPAWPPNPIANTDVFCVADPDTIGSPSPKASFIPSASSSRSSPACATTATAWESPPSTAPSISTRYLGNPLVFCGCVGLIPRDKIEKAAARRRRHRRHRRPHRPRRHSRRNLLSAELTDTHADEFSHAVQIGNAITEKKVADVILAARDRNLFTAITDCGAGGLSSAVGEMGEKTGAYRRSRKSPPQIRRPALRRNLDQRSPGAHGPLRAAGKHVSCCNWPPAKMSRPPSSALRHPRRELDPQLRGAKSADSPWNSCTTASPCPRAKRHRRRRSPPEAPRRPLARFPPIEFKAASPGQSLLAHPNIASKHWIIRQYDHEVQGGSVIKPLTGPLQIGPSDAAVLRPKLSIHRGVALGCGMVARDR